MLYEELQQRYGKHVAKRIQRELDHREFSQLNVDSLRGYLESRAENVARDYKSIMENPLERGNVRSEVLQMKWREAEELAYILCIAEDVSATVRASMAGDAR